MTHILSHFFRNLITIRFLERLGLALTVLTLAAVALGLLISLAYKPGKILGNSAQYPSSYQVNPQALCPGCNVILISVTNLRYDHVSANGYTRPTTPNIDALAADSLNFQNFYAHSSWTEPGIISLLTGLYPYQHGVMDRYDGSSLPSSTKTLMDDLREYRYTSFQSAGQFDHLVYQGLTTHFDRSQLCLDKLLPTDRGLSQYGKFDCSVPQAEQWLKENKSTKFFLHVQGFDAHCPFSQLGGKTYDPAYSGAVDFSSCLMTFGKTDPIVQNGENYYQVNATDGPSPNTKVLLSPRDVTHLVSIYDEAITTADRQIGDLIETIKSQGLYDKTIIIVTSEHGDMFGKYGRFMRGGPIRGTFYDDVIHVPLVMHIPGVKPAKISGLAQAVDIMPTILHLVGLPQQAGVGGKDLLPLIKTGAAVNEYVYAGSFFNADIINPYFNKKSRIESIRNLDWKMIRETVFDTDGTTSKTTELFNVRNDPEELHNLADSQPEMVRSLGDKLSTWSDSVNPQAKFCFLCL